MAKNSVINLKYSIVTLGCQMNKNDSERLETILQKIGLSRGDSVWQADLIILNSCSVRQSAEDRIYGLVRGYARMKEQNSDLIIAVTGCMPGRDRDGNLRQYVPGADLFFPTKEMNFLPKRLAELNPKFKAIVNAQPESYLDLSPGINRQFQSYLTIQTGCNHFCTYCVVPFARGMEFNRPLADILREARLLVAQGCVELTLLGQIVNHYIAPDPENFSVQNPYRHSDFAKLLWEINQLSDLRRLHWTAAHPIYVSDEVIDALLLPKQVNYLHLPVQSGNNNILKQMNRRHTREFYLELVEKIRTKAPEIALGTDIIVGFCGETVEQFYGTVDLYQACDFDISYIAQYSQRSGTVAEKIFVDNVPKAKKKHRWQVLQELMEKTTLTKNQKYRGKEVSVLVDSHKDGMCVGNSLEMKRVVFAGGRELIGKIVLAQVVAAKEWILEAELC